MTDRLALLAAVATSPEDDTPRLVYADWLDEHGEPSRAEFIRVQCAEAALSAREVVADLSPAESARRTELRARERALLRRLRPRLRAEADPHPACAFCLGRNLNPAAPGDALALARGFFDGAAVGVGTWPLGRGDRSKQRRSPFGAV